MENAGQMFSGAKDATVSPKAVPSLTPEKVFHVGQMRAGAVDCTKSLKNASTLTDSRFGKMRAGATEIKEEELPKQEVVETVEEKKELDGTMVGNHLWDIPTMDWTNKVIKDVLSAYEIFDFAANARKQTLIDLLNKAKAEKGILDLSLIINPN